MNAAFLRLRDFFVSLQLTVVLLLMSMVLVFVATLDQVNLGIWAVQEKFFRSFFVTWQVPDTSVSLPIFPGGYLVGGLLLVNLVCAHVYRFRFTWRKSGIQLAHAGLIVLLLGELLTGLFQQDSSMRLEEGETKKYSESFRAYELVFVDHTAADYDEVVAVPDSVLADRGVIQHPQLPFQARIKEFHVNATLQMREANATGANPATLGIGTRVGMTPMPPTYKPDEVNVPAAYVEITTAEGPVGTFLVSPLLGAPQTFPYRGHVWDVALRLKRQYFPFALTLLKVTHEVYPGTDIPKNFASRVRVKSDDGKDDREVTIFMNNPLRFGGQTFYQYQMNAAGHLSVFQVVRNPGWLLPYVACIMMGVGLLIQFGLSLSTFFRRRATATTA